MTLEILEKNYKKYKWFVTSSNKLVLGGKSAEQNDELIGHITSLKNNYLIMHTTSPGSPFTVILSSLNNLINSDLKEAAIFTACFSQQWKLGKKSASVDFFLSDKVKDSSKKGSWKVEEKIDSINVKLELILSKQKKVLRCIPENNNIPASLKLLRIVPGKLDKEKASEFIYTILNQKFNKVEILNSLPSGGIKIKK